MIKTIQSIIILLFVINLNGIAQEKYCFKPNEIAFNGNDLVEYFSKGVVKGSKKYKYIYDGLNLYFVNSTNREKFIADPEEFLPAYNGYCAIALAQGELSRPNYDNFKIQDGKLLFFGVKAFYNMRTDWEKDPKKNRELADNYFVSFFNEETLIPLNIPIKNEQDKTTKKETNSDQVLASEKHVSFYNNKLILWSTIAALIIVIFILTMLLFRRRIAR